MQARELLAVSILREIGQRFLDKRAPPTLDELRKVIPVSRFLLEDSLQDLISYGVLCRDDNEPPHYLLQVSPTTLTVADIRQHFWQGTAEQQQQARDIQRQTGLDGQWLEEVALNPHWTVQALLEKHLGASSKT